MACVGLKLKVTGQGQDVVGLTSFLNQEQFSIQCSQGLGE